jgi:hypothetical protein
MGIELRKLVLYIRRVMIMKLDYYMELKTNIVIRNFPELHRPRCLQKCVALLPSSLVKRHMCCFVTTILFVVHQLY